MSWFKRLIPSIMRTNNESKKGVPEGLWRKCTACDAVLYRTELEKNLEVCPKCHHHLRISARQRLRMFLDEGSQLTELGDEYQAVDLLKFRDVKRYKDRISAANKSTEETEALVVVQGELMTMPVTVAAFEFDYMGGSMGHAVGARFVAGVNHCLKYQLPYVCFTSSGGARMQESLFSLFQMSKTSAALKKLAQAGLPYIVVLTDPTMGGVSASLAMLGDIIIAEPKALIGFAGPRVIEQTVRETLPEGFQRSEFLLEHGAIDMIVDRRDLRTKVARILAKLSRLELPSTA